MKSIKFVFVFIAVGFIIYGINHCEGDMEKPCNNPVDSCSIKDSVK